MQGQAVVGCRAQCRPSLFGGMKIFDRHLSDDGSGAVLFSMANLVNPGTFDLKTMGELEAPGVTLFMALDELADPVDALDIMIEAVDSTGWRLAAQCNGRVAQFNDAKQTIDHYRQRAPGCVSSSASKAAELPTATHMQQIFQSDVLREYERLKDELNQHNHRYYVSGRSLGSGQRIRSSNAPVAGYRVSVSQSQNQ